MSQLDFLLLQKHIFPLEATSHPKAYPGPPSSPWNQMVLPSLLLQRTNTAVVFGL